MTKYALLIAGALVAGTHVVHAAATVKFAVGFADDSGGMYHLRSDYSFDSLGAPITFTRRGVGDYEYTFGKVGSATVGGNVQARGYAQSVRCSILYWFVPTGSSDVTVRITCVDPAGPPADTWTAVQFYSATGNDALETAYLWADSPTAPTYTPSSLYSYNSSGGTNIVSHGSGAGDYLAYLPGLASLGGNPHVTAYGGGASYCKLASWYHAIGGAFVVVHCFDASGAPIDARWSLRYTNGHLADDGAHHGTYHFGDGNFEPALPSPHNYTPTLAWHSGGLTDSVFDDNPHAVAMIPGLTLGVPVSPLVTAVGSDNTYCNPIGMTIASDGVTFLGYTRCFDAAGRLVGTPYTYALWDR